MKALVTASPLSIHSWSFASFPDFSARRASTSSMKPPPAHIAAAAMCTSKYSS